MKENPFSADTQLQIFTQHHPTAPQAIIQVENTSHQCTLAKNNSEQFTVAFNHQEGTWLKIAMKPSLEQRLTTAQKALQCSFELSNISPAQTQLKPVEFNGSERLANQTPHLGISLKFLIEAKLINPNLVSKIYEEAYRLACQLAKQGWLFADPNPGNIIVRELPLNNPPKITLIDFENSRIKSRLPLNPKKVDFLKNKFNKQHHINNTS